MLKYRYKPIQLAVLEQHWLIRPNRLSDGCQSRCGWITEVTHNAVKEIKG